MASEDQIPSSMVMGTTLLVLLSCLGTVVAVALGTFIGATLGGNSGAHFQFAGARGYEATGLVGAIFGAVVAVVISGFAFAWRARLRAAA